MGNHGQIPKVEGCWRARAASSSIWWWSNLGSHSNSPRRLQWKDVVQQAKIYIRPIQASVDVSVKETSFGVSYCT